VSKKQSAASRKANAQRAAERAAAIRKEQERKERRRRTLIISIAVIAVLTLVVVILAAVQAGRDTTGAATTPPEGVVDTYAVPLGEADAPVTVEVVEDFMCPFCGEFEATGSDMLRGFADAGDAQIHYRVVSFLDRASNGTRYSTRAMNALGVVLDESGSDVALAFHDALFENQPAEGSDGLSDDELVDLAVEAGADEDAVRPGIESLKFEQWVANANEQASKDKITGTPTVLVNGERVEGGSIPEIVANTEQAIDAALAG
jgi:protein-disulfide isomerase